MFRKPHPAGCSRCERAGERTAADPCLSILSLARQNCDRDSAFPTGGAMVVISAVDLRRVGARPSYFLPPLFFAPAADFPPEGGAAFRSEEHTSELQSHL